MQIANGASALEKCAMSCHTVNALELACHELAGSDSGTNSNIADDCVLCQQASGGARTAYKVKASGSTSFVCDGDAEAPGVEPAACTGAELMDGESCKLAGAVGKPIFHSDVACNVLTNAVAECDLLMSADGGSCDENVGVLQGGNAIAACRTETIEV